MHQSTRRVGAAARGLLLTAACCLVQTAVAQPGTAAAAISGVDPGLGPVPFTVPEELYKGAVRKFANARFNRRIEYTGDAEFVLVFYASGQAAAADLKALATYVSTPAATIGTAGIGEDACFESTAAGHTLWFRLDALIVGISVPTDALAQAELATLAGQVSADYHRRNEALFSTPEKCVRTYIEAAEQGDAARIIECMYSDGSAASEGAIAMQIHILRLLPVLKQTGLDHRKTAPVNPEIGATEMLSDAEARVALVLPEPVQRPGQAPALMLLTLGVPRAQAAGKPLWIPLKKRGSRWAIHLGSLHEHAIAGAREKALRIQDAGNLKQIGLALRMYSSDHAEHFPNDLGQLFDQGYLKTGKVYICPGSETKPPESGDDIRAGRCDYVYFGRGGEEKNLGPKTAVATTRPDGLAEGFVNVLYGDGHVKGFPVPPEDVKDQLRQAGLYP